MWLMRILLCHKGIKGINFPHGEIQYTATITTITQEKVQKMYQNVFICSS
jgi:hypothetical protein